MGINDRRKRAASGSFRVRSEHNAHPPTTKLLPDTSSRPAGHGVFTDDAWRELATALRLSGRETEILKAVFDDQKESSIAGDLRISIHTVHSHVERLYRKLCVGSRVALVVRVLEEYLSNHHH